MSTPKVNPKDSMKSTWRQDKSQWGLFHWLYQLTYVHPSDLDVKAPVHSKQDPIPSVAEWQLHRWVLYHAALPMVLHQLYANYVGHNMHPVAAFLYYTICFKLIGIHELNLLRRLGNKHGYLDGDKHERDEVPDQAVATVILSLISTVTFRSMVAVIFAYNVDKLPSSINWLALPIEIGLYGVVLDFWFYWYHRVMHQYEGLWKFHRTHHLTKHPNPLLSLYADHEQEFFDIVGIPFLTWVTLKAVGFPMGFYEWWVCHQYVVFAELAGHSGLRLYTSPPSTVSWLLQKFNCELVIEDHDLHHRKGWKKSHNYGKQTRLWDKVFGTCADRIETVQPNFDSKNVANWPLY